MAHSTSVQSPSKLSVAKSSMITKELSTHSHLNFESDLAEKKPSSHTLQKSDHKGNENKPDVNPPTDSEKEKSKKPKKCKCGKSFWIVFAVVGWLLLVVVLIVFLVVGKGLFGEDKDETAAVSSDNQLCLTERCILSASQMIRKMDKSVDPCENFYQYACGGFLSSTIIPQSQVKIWSFSELQETNERHILSIFEDSNSEKESESLKNARNFYKACMDTKKIEEKGDAHLKSLITRTFGDWPLHNGSFDVNSFDLTDKLIKLGKLKYFPLVTITVFSDLQNSKKYSIYMEQPTLSPGSKENFENNEKSNAYRDMVYKFVITLKGDVPNGDVPNNVQDVTKEVVDFKTKLSKILVPPERFNPEMIRRAKLKEITEKYSRDKGINYKKFLQSLFEQEGVNINIGDDEIILNTVPSYFDELTTLIDEEDQRVVANYVLTDMLLTLSAYLPQKYKDIAHEYQQKILGVKQTRRDFQCANGASEAMALAVGAEYARRYFDNDSKKEILIMINEIQKSFNGLIDNTPWMDDKTKIAAKDKNNAITNIMGYDDIILNATYVKNRYIDYVFEPDTYFENVLLLLEKDSIRSLKILRDPVEDKVVLEKIIVPQVVNALYSSTNNKIIFLAGVLQPQLFHKENPKYMNYGGIGMVIGHEITHGFDNKGRLFDKDGNVKAWWTNDSITAFVKETKCFVSQYGNFSIPGTEKKVNGELTLGENIADNGGFLAALQGYRNMVKQRQEAEPKLPGLTKMSNEQLFFLNQAQTWCVKYTKEFAENFLDKDEHSPGELRVKGTLMNSPDFARIFNCPKRSPMNPDKKCRIWGPKIGGT